MTTGATYRSKIGFEILLLTALVLGGIATFQIMNSAWIATAACLLPLLLTLSIFIKTYYKITKDNRLIVRHWIVECWEIEIKDIHSITRSDSDLNNTPLSLNQLEVNYNGGQVLVSPVNKKQFITDLRKVNSNIME